MRVQSKPGIVDSTKKPEENKKPDYDKDARRFFGVSSHCSQKPYENEPKPTSKYRINNAHKNRRSSAGDGNDKPSSKYWLNITALA